MDSIILYSKHEFMNSSIREFLSVAQWRDWRPHGDSNPGRLRERGFRGESEDANDSLDLKQKELLIQLFKTLRLHSF